MAEQKALLLEAPINGEWRVETKPIPKPPPGELLIKIHATGLNPVDWMVRDYNIIIKDYPVILGAEAAGTVEEVGEGVHGFQKGDTVLYEGHMENDRATFQQFSISPAEITAKIPPNISFDEAASVSLCLVTAALALYGDRPAGVKKYKPAWEEGAQGLYSGEPIVITGGATSVGQYAIQLAKLSGFSPIITTASLHNAPLLTSLGATHVIDRHISDIIPEVSEILGGSGSGPGPTGSPSPTPTPVRYIFGIIPDKHLHNQVWDLLAPGGIGVVLGPIQVDEDKLKRKEEEEGEKKTLIDDIFGSAFVFRPLGVSLYSNLTRLLESGTIKPTRVEVLPNGLAGIPEGLDRLRHNKVSGMKLVVRPQETP